MLIAADTLIAYDYLQERVTCWLMPFLRLPRVGDDTENGAFEIEEISTAHTCSEDQSSSLVEPKWSLGVIVVVVPKV